jgi:hypothetical protein
MQAGQATVGQRGIGSAYANSLARLLASHFIQLFGCRHVQMGRPVTLGGETYRSCLGCGARRRFDVAGWRTRGPYYSSSSAGHIQRSH